jgi:hypothetical protein
MRDSPTEAHAESNRLERRGEGEEAAKPAVREPVIFLRTVYVLNPGIPHFLDFPLATH